MTREEKIALINKEVAKLDAKIDDFVKRNATAPASGSVESPVHDFEFEQLVTLQALHAGVLTNATPYVLSDAKQVFERRENKLVPRHGETDPGDPLAALTFDVWLKELRREKEFLFEKK